MLKKFVFEINTKSNNKHLIQFWIMCHNLLFTEPHYKEKLVISKNMAGKIYIHILSSFILSKKGLYTENIKIINSHFIYMSESNISYKSNVIYVVPFYLFFFIFHFDAKDPHSYIRKYKIKVILFFFIHFKIKKKSNSLWHHHVIYISFK